MPIPTAFLLSLQAGGMIFDYLGKNNQIEMMRMGQRIEEEGINAAIATTRLNAEQESVAALKELRQNLGSQMAMFAARGTRLGAGSAALAPLESIRNVAADEQIRKINLLGKEAQLRAGSVLSKLHQQTAENTIWNEFRQSAFNTIGTRFDTWGGIAKGLKKDWTTVSEGFGLKSIGV